MRHTVLYTVYSLVIYIVHMYNGLFKNVVYKGCTISKTKDTIYDDFLNISTVMNATKQLDISSTQVQL